MLLDEILVKLQGLDPASKAKVLSDVEAATKELKFIPNVGPQLEAYNSEADILLYGGEPGGGKTGLLIGLALNKHHRSLIIRKQFADVEGVVDNARDMVGSNEGFIRGNRPKYNKPDGGVIHFEGMGQLDTIDTSKQGTPRDFIGIDEGAQLSKNTIMMLIGWNRTKIKGQRCRMVIASNPPTDSVGDWMVDFFAPWLNHTYHKPAKPGELRWFIIDERGDSKEVEGKDPITINGRKYYPHSRTFIPAGLEDNPFIDAAEYRRRLDAMPEPYRSILLSGNFMMARQDDLKQVIPTAWVREAMSRWTPNPPHGVPMCAMGMDIAQGGIDNTVLAWRHDGWFAPLIKVPGTETPSGAETSALIFKHRRDNPVIVIDMGGGYGGATLEHLKANGLDVKAYKGAEAGTKRTSDGSLGFWNKRAQDWWKLREALDPNQPGGSSIMLPDDPELLSDLTAVRMDGEITARGIKLESKDKVKERIGRSPDKGDAVVMAWSAGLTIANQQDGKWNHKQRPKVFVGHDEKRRRR